MHPVLSFFLLVNARDDSLLDKNLTFDGQFAFFMEVNFAEKVTDMLLA